MKYFVFDLGGVLSVPMMTKKLYDEIKWNIPFEKFAVNVDYAGNTSSVGIPLALSEQLANGKRPKKALLTGFGAGLVYGSLLLDLSDY